MRRWGRTNDTAVVEGEVSDVVGISVAVAVGRSMVRAGNVEYDVDVTDKLRCCIDGWL